MASPEISGKSAFLTVDLGAIAANYRLLRARVHPAEVAAVVKADAYGMGVKKIMPVLEQENCPFYYVATLDEGLEVRSLTQKPVGVFGGLFGAPESFVAASLIPVLSCLEDVRSWQEEALKHGKKLPAILQLETGMNRLGLTDSELSVLEENPAILEALDIQYVMSHFACADEKDHPLTTLQFERFAALSARLPKARRSLANSSGIFRSSEYYFEQVRSGMALYGSNPTLETKSPMNPVVSLKARIIQVKTVPQGESVGYGATHRFDRPTTVASISLGFADGILRSLGNRGVVYYDGKPCPVIGRVSMDCMTIDMGDLKPKVGEFIEVLGQHQHLGDLANQAGTIDYEILTSLGRRYKQIYING